MFDNPKWVKCEKCGKSHVDYLGCSQCDDTAREAVLSTVFVCAVIVLVIWMAVACS